jgi:hypothetical protein
MTKSIEVKLANKNCLGCTKTFSYDVSIKKLRKFCSRNCYLNSMKGSVVKGKWQRFISLFKFFALFIMNYEILQEDIYSHLIQIRVCECEEFILEEDLQFDIE